MLKEMEKVMVTYSGGVDSSLLAYACLKAIPDGTTAFMADIPYLSGRQRAVAFSTAESMGLPLLVCPVEWDEMLPAHVNDDLRCYHCKNVIYSHARETAQEMAIDHILDGENADDQAESRPGRRAAKAHGLISPLRELDFRRQEIEELVERFQIPLSIEKETCLATRISAIELNEDLLSMVEAAEAAIRCVCPLKELRLRLKDGQFTIQVSQQDMVHVLNHRERILESLLPLGIDSVSLNLIAYESHR